MRNSFPPSRGFLLRVLALAALLAGARPALAADPAAAGGAHDSPGWVFELLPKAFQKNPRLDLTVITELTAEGRQRPATDPQHPAYYVAQSGGYRRTADAPPIVATLTAGEIDAFVRRSLATRGYLPATAAAPASLVLVYSWGVHARMTRDGATDDQVERNLADRAALVGGEKFQRQFTALLADATAQAEAALNSPTRHLVATGVGIGPVLGADQLEFLSPMNRFRDSSFKNGFLLEQVRGDVYFVVVSAYDHDALARGQRTLWWRTRMTVSAAGVSQAESLPTLIRVAAPYLGVEMDEAATLTPRAVREGRVEAGEPTVIDDAAQPPPPETKPRK